MNNHKRKFRYDRLIILLAIFAIVCFLIYFLIKGIVYAFTSLFVKERKIPETIKVLETYKDYDKLLPAVPVDTVEIEERYYPEELIYDQNSAQLASTVNSQYAILYCIDDRKVIARKASQERMYPASMTKIMSLIVAVENIEDLNDTFTMTFEIINPLYLQDATITGFKSGDIVKLEDLLYGVILPSGADATVSLAHYVSGSEEKFVELMNKKAEELGLKDTHFTNTSGLHDPNHYTTAYDMAIILDYAIHNETCKRILSTYSYTTKSTTTDNEGNIVPIEFYSTMFKKISRGNIENVEICGGKTGYTSQAKYCLASFAKKNNKTYIAVTAGAPTGWEEIKNDINTLYTTYLS